MISLGVSEVAREALGDLMRGLTRNELASRFVNAVHALEAGDAERAKSILLLEVHFKDGSLQEHSPAK